MRWTARKSKNVVTRVRKMKKKRQRVAKLKAVGGMYGKKK